MKFVGVDLGWLSGASGLCCLSWADETLALHSLDCRADSAGVLAWVDDIAPAGTPAMIAVDAPTLIPNETGMRSPDRLAHKYFGKFHAGCYPANQNRPFATRLIQFGKDLESRGFAHSPTIEPRQAGRYQIEVFPHPAMIQLFKLSRILKYKKGRLAQRKEGLGQLRHYILEALPHHTPPLLASELPAIPSAGKAMKAVEDQLDSIVCAYVGAYWWYWGSDRNRVLGSKAEGYIVVPCPPDAPVPVSIF